MKGSVNHSRFAIILSIGSGLLLGLAVYLSWLYAFRSLAFCAFISVLFGILGFLLMRLVARVMAWLTGADARSLEPAGAVAVASWLVIYLGAFPLPFVYMPFHPEKWVLIALVVFLIVNLFTFLIVSRRWVILGLLVLIVLCGTTAILVHSLQSNVRPGLPLLDRVTYSALPGNSPDNKDAPFRVHHGDLTRTGFWLNMNQSLEKAVMIPEEGRLRFEIGVVHPGKDLAPARIQVMAKDRSGQVQNVMGLFINRENFAWTSHEARVSGLSPGKGIIRFQVLSTDKEHENLQPLIISNFSLFPERDRPGGHVIIVVLDALRADALGCYGGEEAQTPVIDRLASQGVLFDKAITPCSWTMPAVASILTSRFPSQHGLIGFFWSMHDRSLPSLPELLAQQGVFTKASIGNRVVYPTANFDKGFNRFFLVPVRKIIWRGTEALMSECDDWLRAYPGSPFFLYIHNLDPHHPYLAPEPYRFGPRIKSEGSGGDVFQKIFSWIAFGLRVPYLYGLSFDAVNPLTGPEVDELRQRYLGEVEYVDAQMAVLERALKETGLWEDTLLIITADHGEEFQEHGTLRHGQDLHREVVRVPLIFTGGVMQGRSKRIASPVSLLDLYPTILEFFGVRIPPDTMGQSLWPIIEGESGGRRIVFSEMIEHYTPKYMFWSAVNGDYHLIKKVGLLEDAPAELNLYRWDTDPGEQHELSSIEPDMAREMEQTMDDFFENLPGKKRLYVSEEQHGEIQKVLRAMGYLR